MNEFSVCILSYNRPKYLKESLSSVFDQTVIPDEILIFDNGSQINLLKEIEHYIQQGAKWFGSETTKSVNWNFRRAMNQASGKFILILHDDDRLCSNFIERMIDFFKKNPNIAAVSSNGFLIDSNGIKNGQTLFKNKNKESIKFFNSDIDVALCYANDECIPFSPTVYQKEIVSNVALRDDVGKVCDAVFFCDLANYSAIALCEEPLYECRIHDGQDSANLNEINFKILENIFTQLSLKYPDEGFQLRKLLSEQKTRRMLIRLKLFLKKIFIDKEFSNFDMNGFSIINISKILFKAIKKRI
jgi:glycosyltransferase involved in cell wall biosynthesis